MNMVSENKARKFYTLPKYSNYEVNKMFNYRGWVRTYTPEEADLLVFTGGEDVTPHLYNEDALAVTRFNVNRDKDEFDFFLAMPKDKPKVGICRGGQFLNVVSGGAMWQDCDGHALAGTHQMLDHWHGELIDVTSTHHQMMRPSEYGLVLGTAAESNYKRSYAGTIVPNHTKAPNSDLGLDIEIVFYPHTNSLCFQPHPEFENEKNSNMTSLFFELINETLLSNVLPEHM